MLVNWDPLLRDPGENKKTCETTIKMKMMVLNKDVSPPTIVYFARFKLPNIELQGFYAGTKKDNPWLSIDFSQMV